MKRIIAFALSLFGSQAAAEQELHEASMNFDMGNVRPFIEKLNSALGLELNVNELTKAVSETPVDSETSVNLEVIFAGKKQKLIFKAYMDDVDAPDLYLFSDSPELAKSINSTMINFAEERGL